MGFTYLNGKNWLDVTREERLFCAYLYWDIKGKEKDFVLWLNRQKTELKLNINDTWEAGYEVCFYRDLLKLNRKQVWGSGYPQKRTFDLCLFSKDTIVIVEAKVQQRFSKAQIDDIQQDIVTFIPKLKKEEHIEGLNVHVVLLASSWYLESTHKRVNLPSDFLRISWKQIHEKYERELYKKADDIYHLERTR